MKKKIEKIFKRIVKEIVVQVLNEKKYNIKDGLQDLALRETCEWLQGNVPLNLVYEDRFALLTKGLEEVEIENGLFLEFGVYKGETINHISRFLDKTSETIFGFDSFEGLNEPWIFRGEGGFSDVKGGLPLVNKNVELIKGFFDSSLPLFLKDKSNSVAFLHIDSDLYSSAKTIFNCLQNRIKPGTVIVFDEFFNYPGWKSGEFKAWNEFVEEYKISFEYLGYTYQKTETKKSGNQLAVKIKSIG